MSALDEILDRNNWKIERDFCEDGSESVFCIWVGRKGAISLEAKKELEDLRARTSWQPIETCPENTVVLFCNTYKKIYEDFVGVGWWNIYNSTKHFWGFGFIPTHWMPLPEPPCKE
jgi:hypothetical protein